MQKRKKAKNDSIFTRKKTNKNKELKNVSEKDNSVLEASSDIYQLFSPTQSVGESDLEKILKINQRNTSNKIIEGNDLSVLEVGDLIDDEKIKNMDFTIGIKSNRGDNFSIKIKDFVGAKVKDLKAKIFNDDILSKT